MNMFEALKEMVPVYNVRQTPVLWYRLIQGFEACIQCIHRKAKRGERARHGRCLCVG